MSFERIIGHNEIKKQLNNSLKLGSLSHAHIFCGEDGIGKSLIAKELSLHILGRDEERQFVDIVEWRVPKGKQSIGINDILGIIAEINKKPYEGDKKVIIIHEAHRMTMEAQNAFLKTIEEPPVGVFILLLCESLEDILDTIKSRCQIHKLRRVNKEDVERFIKCKYPEVNEEQRKILISFSDGIPGRVVKLIEDGEFSEIRNKVLEVISCCLAKNKADILKHEDFFVKNKLIWREVLTCFITYIRDILIYKETRNEEFIINSDKYVLIKELAGVFSFNKLSGMIDVINKTAENLESNVNIALAVDTMLLNIQEV